MRDLLLELIRKVVELVETLFAPWPAEELLAHALGVDFAHPGQAPGGRDLVVHASAAEAGLRRSLELLAPDGEVVDLSWYGDTEVRLSLGGAFHAGRLGIRSSQVGTLSPARAARRTTADRRPLALDRVRDTGFDATLTGESRVDGLTTGMAPTDTGRLPALCSSVT